MITYRLDLDESDYRNLKEMLKLYEKEKNRIIEHNKNCNEIEGIEELYLSEELVEKIMNPKQINSSGKKILAAEKATQARTEKAKRKIENAVNLLRLEGREITPYIVAKKAHVSFVTAKKYLTSLTSS